MLQINGALGSNCSILNTLRLVVNSAKIGNTLTHDNETSVAKSKINRSVRLVTGTHSLVTLNG